MFCGAGSNLYLLTHWARDDGRVQLEQAVHCLTQRTADFFSLHDRGVIEPGRRGDLAVFALDEIETRGLERRYDLPEAATGSPGRARGSGRCRRRRPDRARRRAHRRATHRASATPWPTSRLLSFGVAPPTSDGAYRRQNGQVNACAQTSRSYCFAIGNRAITSAAARIIRRHALAPLPGLLTTMRYVS